MDTDLGPGREASLGRAVEAFSRDLLALIRSVRVYPAEHPLLQDLAERIRSLLEGDLGAPVSFGVTPGELAVGSFFVGARHRRAAELASLLHGRKVLRMSWTDRAEPSEVIAFAEVLADSRGSGEDLTAALERRRVQAVELEPLVLSRIHDSFQEGARKEPTEAKGRGAWVWLLRQDLPPAEAAEILASESFWASLDASGLSPQEAQELTTLLAQMGERLGEALDCLPDDRRGAVEDRLAWVGRMIAPGDLARILKAADALGVLRGPIGEALEQTFGTDKLVDLLANLVAVEGRGTRRLADVYARFASGMPPASLLTEVRARMGSRDRGGFAAEVWGAVEEFLLTLEEDPFMGADYSSSLEALAAVSGNAAAESEELDLTEDPDDCLDAVTAGLAVHDPETWGPRWLERLGSRLDGERVRRLLPLLLEVDGTKKGLLDSRPDLVEKTFRLGTASLRELDPAFREALLAFGLAHESVLLNPVLKALALEESMTVRRFLVDLISRFSSSSTPALVSRMRSAPWYVTRNLVIALGRRREAAAMPALRSLLGHDHSKVRREAILALGQLDNDEARQTLTEFSRAKAASGEERGLAARALRLRGRWEASA